MEMESSSTWVVDTSLDLNINSYFKNLHQDHHVPALPDHHKKKYIFQENLGNLQVNNEESSLNKEESSVLVKEFNRISCENQKLTEMLTCMCDKYNVLQTHFLELKEKNNPPISDKQVVTTMKRKATSNDHYFGQNSSSPMHIINNGVTESSSSDHEDTNNSKRQKQEDVIKNKVSTVLVRTDASNMNSLVVKDGYQWRKYGQKVTRDNPSPRAYFKCSFAPTCPVKKKVQRSFENPSVLVATYEGEHNHLQPCRAEFTFCTNQAGQGSTIMNVHGSGSMNPSSSPSSVTTLDHLVQPETNNNNNHNHEASGTEPAIFQRFLVQQMATSLTKDPNFTAALAAAISGRFLDHTTSNV